MLDAIQSQAPPSSRTTATDIIVVNPVCLCVDRVSLSHVRIASFLQTILNPVDITHLFPGSATISLPSVLLSLALAPIHVAHRLLTRVISVPITWSSAATIAISPTTTASTHSITVLHRLLRTVTAAAWLDVPHDEEQLSVLDAQISVWSDSQWAQMIQQLNQRMHSTQISHATSESLLGRFAILLHRLQVKEHLLSHHARCEATSQSHRLSLAMAVASLTTGSNAVDDDDQESIAKSLMLSPADPISYRLLAASFSMKSLSSLHSSDVDVVLNSSGESEQGIPSQCDGKTSLLYIDLPWLQSHVQSTDLALSVELQRWTKELIGSIDGSICTISYEKQFQSHVTLKSRVHLLKSLRMSAFQSMPRWIATTSSLLSLQDLLYAAHWNTTLPSSDSPPLALLMLPSTLTRFALAQRIADLGGGIVVPVALSDDVTGDSNGDLQLHYQPSLLHRFITILVEATSAWQTRFAQIFPSLFSAAPSQPDPLVGIIQPDTSQWHSEQMFHRLTRQLETSSSDPFAVTRLAVKLCPRLFPPYLLSELPVVEFERSLRALLEERNEVSIGMDFIDEDATDHNESPQQTPQSTSWTSHLSLLALPTDVMLVLLLFATSFLLFSKSLLPPSV